MDGNGGGAAGEGFGRKLAFVTAPMLVTALMMIYADVQPVPMPGANAPLKPDDTSNMTARILMLESELRAAQAEAEMKEWKLRALEDAMRRGPGPVEAWVDSLGGQKALAVTGMVLGLLSIAGPTSFVRFYLAVVGSALGGLLVAAFANLLAGYSGSPFWFDSIWALTGGRGSIVEYSMWAALFCLGMLRWYTGWECGIYAYGDDVEFEFETTMALNKPLVPGDTLQVTVA